MALRETSGCRNSDARHCTHQMILFDHLAYRGLEVGHMLLPSLLHHFSHLCLALLERFDCFSRRCKFLSRAAESRIVEIDFLESHLEFSS